MNSNFKPSGLEEGYVINHWIDGRFNRNKNILAATVGETGSGKSYSNMRIVELWYMFKFKQKYPDTYICFSIKDAMKLINSGSLPKGSILIVEEAGVNMNSLDFQNKIIKFFGFVLQSFRSKNIGIIFNLPNINFLTKTARLLLHAIFVTTTIDKTKKEVVLKAFRCQVNPMTGKVYNKHFRIKINGQSVPIKRIRYSMPSKELVELYEKRKNDFVDKIGQQLMDTLDEMDKVEDEPSLNDPINIAIDKCLSEGITKQVDIGKKLGVSQKTIGQYMRLRWKNGVFSLENSQNKPINPILTSIST